MWLFQTELVRPVPLSASILKKKVSQLRSKEIHPQKICVSSDDWVLVD